MKAYVFDIDGTLSDLTHRLHFIQCDPPNWDAFFGAVAGDLVHEHIAVLVRTLEVFHHIVLVSGRSDQCRTGTEYWLRRHGIPFNRLYMRKQGDRREDDLVKKELLDALRADGYEPVMAFDDRDRVVKMWRENGIPCAQVADGNF
jgi:hypothetical protein